MTGRHTAFRAFERPAVPGDPSKGYIFGFQTPEARFEVTFEDREAGAAWREQWIRAWWAGNMKARQPVVEPAPAVSVAIFGSPSDEHADEVATIASHLGSAYSHLIHAQTFLRDVDPEIASALKRVRQLIEMTAESLNASIVLPLIEAPVEAGNPTIPPRENPASTGEGAS